MNYTLGQTVWVKFNYRSPDLKPYTVTKVGRKWVELDGGPYRVEVGQTQLEGRKGYSSPGQVYESPEAYQQAIALWSAWAEFKSIVGSKHTTPPGVTLAAIEQAKALLKLAVP